MHAKNYLQITILMARFKNVFIFFTLPAQNIRLIECETYIFIYIENRHQNVYSGNKGTFIICFHR